MLLRFGLNERTQSWDEGKKFQVSLSSSWTFLSSSWVKTQPITTCNPQFVSHSDGSWSRSSSFHSFNAFVGSSVFVGVSFKSEAFSRENVGVCEAPTNYGKAVIDEGSRYLRYLIWETIQGFTCGRIVKQIDDFNWWNVQLPRLKRLSSRNH